MLVLGMILWAKSGIGEERRTFYDGNKPVWIIYTWQSKY